MGDLVVVAPVMPAREHALREHLRGLDPSPLAQLPHETHFARFVILPVDGPRLLFSSRFDVSVPRYLDALARLPEAADDLVALRVGGDLATGAAPRLPVRSTASGRRTSFRRGRRSAWARSTRPSSDRPPLSRF